MSRGVVRHGDGVADEDNASNRHRGEDRAAANLENTELLTG